MQEPARLIVASAKALGRFRSILEQMGAPDFSKEPFFGPYVDAFRRVGEERRVDLAGCKAGEDFAELWDRRCRDFIERTSPKLQFTAAEQTRLLHLLTEFDDWITRSFPECGNADDDSARN